MSQVQIFEVGLRDGLQNEHEFWSVPRRIDLALKLLDAGVSKMELGAFVRADKVPQMAGSKEVIEGVLAYCKKTKFKNRNPKFSVLVPNEKGMMMALNHKIDEVAIFASCTESFSQKNINCSIDESYERFKPVLEIAKAKDISVRGYLSVCFGCPYEGKVSSDFVLTQIERMLKMGVYEVSLGDTIGVAKPQQTLALVGQIKNSFGLEKIAGHFHDTGSLAVANIAEAYSLGVKTFDTSIHGLGGCPYAPGASGNVSTEAVVNYFHSQNIQTGIDLNKLKLVQ